MELQELISRGRFIFGQASGRLKVFSLVNGRNSAKVIAERTNKRPSNTLRDLQKLRDVGLIEPKWDKGGQPAKIDGSIVYQKVPLARHIPLTYFEGSTKVKKKPVTLIYSRPTEKPPKARPIAIPTENEILDICKQGEDQIYEFKGPGADVRKITREIAGFLNTRQGGIVLYGVEDDGTIVGTDVSRQKLDQSVQNSVRNTISPSPNVQLRSAKVMGTDITLIIIPPWNRNDVYYYDGRVNIRKGTNVFVAKPEEIKKLHKGQSVV